MFFLRNPLTEWVTCNPRVSPKLNLILSEDMIHVSSIDNRH